MSFKSSDKLPNRRHLSQLNKSSDEAEMAFNARRVIVISLICLSLCIILSLCGCTKSQRALFRDGIVTVSDCAFYTLEAHAAKGDPLIVAGGGGDALYALQLPRLGVGYGDGKQAREHERGRCEQ